MNKESENTQRKDLWLPSDKTRINNKKGSLMKREHARYCQPDFT